MRCPGHKYLSQYLDAGLSNRRRKSIEAHLASCTECSGMLAEMSRISSMLKGSGLFSAPPDFSQRVMARVAEAKDRRHSRFSTAFIWAAEFAAVLLVLIIGAAFGLSTFDLQGSRWPYVMFDVFEPMPANSLGAIYFFSAEAGHEK